MQIAFVFGWRVGSRSHVNDCQHVDDHADGRHGAYNTAGLFPVGHDHLTPSLCAGDLGMPRLGWVSAKVVFGRTSSATQAVGLGSPLRRPPAYISRYLVLAIVDCQSSSRRATCCGMDDGLYLVDHRGRAYSGRSLGFDFSHDAEMVKHEAGPPMDLANMRRQGVRSLIAYCLNDACRHQGIIDVSSYPGDTLVPWFRSKV